MKNLDYSVLMTPHPKATHRDLRVSVQNTDLGPEMLVARPFYSGQEMGAMLVTSFDFNALMAQVESSEALIVRSVDIPLWTGPQYSAGALSGVDWAEELRHHSTGEVGGHPWLVRYTGYLPLIFASTGQ